VSSSPLRWFAAAAFSVALIAGLYYLAADHLRLRPGKTVEAVQRLAGRTPDRAESGEALVLSGSRRVRGRLESGRSGGLGARLVESGRPHRALSPLEAGSLPGAAAQSELRARPPGHIKPPAPASKATAAARARSVAAAREVSGGNFAPKRRKIPSRAGSDAKLRAALKVPRSVPRLKAGDDKLPVPPAKPGVEFGKRVAPPASNERLPAPVVPLNH
jgi:hypothetical protein